MRAVRYSTLKYMLAALPMTLFICKSSAARLELLMREFDYSIYLCDILKLMHDTEKQGIKRANEV